MPASTLTADAVDSAGLPWWHTAALSALATACAALPLLNRSGWWEWSAVAGVALVSGWGAWLQTHHSSMQEEAPASAAAEGRERMEALLKTVLPVWLRHVGTVKEQ